VAKARAGADLADRGVEGIGIEPARVVAAECIDARPKIESSSALECLVGAVDKRVGRIISVHVIGRAACRVQRAVDRRVVDEPLERTTRPERGDGDIAQVAREDRAVIRRWIRARGLALWPELDAGEAETAGVVEQTGSRACRRRAPSQILVGVGRKAHVVDREQHASHAEPGETFVERDRQRG
jgi:hypothetical protein